MNFEVRHQRRFRGVSPFAHRTHVVLGAVMPGLDVPPQISILRKLFIASCALVFPVAMDLPQVLDVVLPPIEYLAAHVAADLLNFLPVVRFDVLLPLPFARQLFRAVVTLVVQPGFVNDRFLLLGVILGVIL